MAVEPPSPSGSALPRDISECCRSSVVEHSLGKGEADSSILSGSTILPSKIKRLSLRLEGSSGLC